MQTEEETKTMEEETKRIQMQNRGAKDADTAGDVASGEDLKSRFGTVAAHPFHLFSTQDIASGRFEQVQGIRQSNA